MKPRRSQSVRSRRAIVEVPSLSNIEPPVPRATGAGTPTAPPNPRLSEMVQILSDHPFLHGMAPGFLHSVAGAARVAEFDKDEFLLRERQLADGLYLILKGRVALEMTSPGRPGVKVQTVGAGEVAGWSWLVPPFSSTLDVRALEPTQVIKIDASTLRELLRRKPAMGYDFLMRLLPILAQRLEYTMIQVMNVYGI